MCSPPEVKIQIKLELKTITGKWKENVSATIHSAKKMRMQFSGFYSFQSVNDI